MRSPPSRSDKTREEGFSGAFMEYINSLRSAEGDGRKMAEAHMRRLLSFFGRVKREIYDLSFIWMVVACNFNG